MYERQELREAAYLWRPFRPLTNWWIWHYRSFLTGRGYPLALVRADDGERDAMLIHKCPTKDDPYWTMSLWHGSEHTEKKIETKQIRDIDSDRAQAGYNY